MLRDDLWFATIDEIAPEIRARRLSSTELTRGFLDRIERLNSRFNAFERPTPELAMDQAARADSDLKANRWKGPLHGVPYAAKDLFDTRLVPTAWGTKFLRDRVPAENATVIDRLEAAGAVLLGKTAMVEFAGCLGYRFANASASGPGSRTPGTRRAGPAGSSSRSGAAVGRRGSRRSRSAPRPGVRSCARPRSAASPASGPRTGSVSRAGGMVGAYTFDMVGPLARSAADCRTVLAAIAGADSARSSCATETTKLDRGAGRPWRELRAGARVARLEQGRRAGGEGGVRSRCRRAVRGRAADGGDAAAGRARSEVSGLLIGMEALAAFEPFLADGPP
jgi:Asp-tRNA(Asn)/Glu-tRNA(Gln) amidotransferase A subunit family amidase